MPKNTSPRAQAQTPLEAELQTLTAEFVARIVSTLKRASFADVAALSPSIDGHASSDSGARAARASVTIPHAKRSAPALTSHGSHGAAGKNSGGRRPRQTADKRAELVEKVVATLTKAGAPLGVRALSSELGVAPDMLAAPLKVLRDAGRVAKHGDKRATTYSVS